jgi:hypothetical protein
MDTLTYRQQWEANNKERRKIYKREYYKRNKEKMRINTLEWKKNNTERSKLLDRKSQLKRYYNLTIEQYEQLVTDQKGLCALCGKPLDLTINNHVDHNHSCCKGERSCGKCVRGILHAQCNRILGQANDDIQLLEQGIEYLKKHQ